MLTLVFDPQGDLLESARECEAEVFEQWFGNSRKQLEDEYRPYESSSFFVAVADASGQVLAAARAIYPTPQPTNACTETNARTEVAGRGLKTLDDLSRPPWGVDAARSAAAAGIDPRTTGDVATLGVRGGLRGSGVHLAAAVYHGLIVMARVNRVSSFTAILDERPRALLTSLGIVMHPLPGARTAPYLGSPASTPVYAHIGTMLDNQRRHLPDAHRLVTRGVGLDGIRVPEDSAFLVKPRVLQLDLTQKVGALA